jgi:hypothetical protein
MKTETMLITGGKRNRNAYDMDCLAECYEAGIYEVDFGRKRLRRTYLETKPDYNLYSKNYSLTFRSGAIHNGDLYTCTHSEIVVFDLQRFAVKDRMTHRLFNDIHHVLPVDGKERLWIANTGLDRVGEYTVANQLRLHPVLAPEQITPLDETIDYRKVSTKPHQVHPNHVFQLNGNLWATRFNQQDAFCVAHPQKTIPIPAGKPHDGLVTDGRLYFTTVNGTVVRVDPDDDRRSQTFDISSLYRGFNPGWCRALAVDKDVAYVGYSAFRWTYHLENIRFIGNSMRDLARQMGRQRPARIVKYDMRRKQIVDEMIFSDGDIHLIFSVLFGNAPDHGEF